MDKSEVKKPRALVVEDQKLFRDAVADELTFFGFQSTTAEDGEEGLKLAKQIDFDLILSDMRMPNKDGRWLLGELRKTRKSYPPFIFMSGFSDVSAREAFALGADGFLGKPLNFDRLTALLTRVCKPIAVRWREKPLEQPEETVRKFFTTAEHQASELAFGRGGMFLAMDQTPLRVGDLIAFDLQFGQGRFKRLEGIGTIVWREEAAPGRVRGETGYGIDFEYLSPLSLVDWLTFVSEREIVAVIPQGLDEPVDLRKWA